MKDGGILKKEEMIYYSILTDAIFEKEYKDMDAEDFFNLSDEEIKNTIRSFVEDEKEIEIVKAGIISYFDY